MITAAPKPFTAALGNGGRSDRDNKQIRNFREISQRGRRTRPIDLLVRRMHNVDLACEASLPEVLKHEASKGALALTHTDQSYGASIENPVQTIGANGKLIRPTAAIRYTALRRQRVPTVARQPFRGAEAFAST